MCVGRPAKPAGPPPLSAEEKAEQEAAKAREEQARKDKEAAELRKQNEEREKSLEKKARSERGGTGATSLLTGGRGGMGYFDETL